MGHQTCLHRALACGTEQTALQPGDDHAIVTAHGANQRRPAAMAGFQVAVDHRQPQFAVLDAVKQHGIALCAGQMNTQGMTITVQGSAERMGPVAYRQTLCLIAPQVDIFCQPVATVRGITDRGKVVLVNRDSLLLLANGHIITPDAGMMTPLAAVRRGRC